MKDELKTMETYLKELEGLKKYDEVKRLNQEVSELTATLSEVQAERDKLKEELLVRQQAEEEAYQLKEALSRAEEELSILKEAKAVLKGGNLTLEEAAQEFIKAREAEIKARVERESEGLKKNFEARLPRLVYERLLAVLKEPMWPAEIAQVIEEKAEDKTQSRLNEEFQQRVDKEALDRLEQLKRTEWRPFLEEEVSRIGSNLRILAAELQGTWYFTCEKCQSRVTVEIGPREIAALLKGERVAECPRCRDFNLPPAPPFAPHKINGSALEDLLEAYLAGKPSRKGHYGKQP